MTITPDCGDICNEHGDILFSRGGPPIAEGRILLPFGQAFAALRHGWRWIETDDGKDITVQRGGFAWKSRK